ncbi:hypothetical protein PIB30_075911 [Stylosanthes scabra]|uniref:Transposase n=1 Tax=Stylosanthes scabra TaxID=79078 RepID=A0ABU6USM0_9FABA|nr:hypothetical protein [Stylosanthes scabra]
MSCRIYVGGIKKFDKNKQFFTLQKDETEKKVSRAEMWGITHKKKDGSYVNEQAKEIAEKTKAHCTQQSIDSTINSPLDALGVVFENEHPGRVRGKDRVGATPEGDKPKTPQRKMNCL